VVEEVVVEVAPPLNGFTSLSTTPDRTKKSDLI
jgi:hypothetical protein